MRFDTQAKLANFLTQVEFYGLGLDYPRKYLSIIKAITRRKCSAAQTYLHPDNYILVVVGNRKRREWNRPMVT
jgi:zinc protease